MYIDKVTGQQAEGPEFEIVWLDNVFSDAVLLTSPGETDPNDNDPIPENQ